MITIIQSNIPKCPDCSSGMALVHRQEQFYYNCEHCGKPFRVIGKGQIDNEILISDNITDKVEE